MDLYALYKQEPSYWSSSFLAHQLNCCLIYRFLRLLGASSEGDWGNILLLSPQLYCFHHCHSERLCLKRLNLFVNYILNCVFWPREPRRRVLRRCLPYRQSISSSASLPSASPGTFCNSTLIACSILCSPGAEHGLCLSVFCFDLNKSQPIPQQIILWSDASLQTERPSHHYLSGRLWPCWSCWGACCIFLLLELQITLLQWICPSL